MTSTTVEPARKFHTLLAGGTTECSGNCYGIESRRDFRAYANRARSLRLSLWLLCGLFFAVAASPGRAVDAAAPDRAAALRGCLATYNAPPRGADGRVDQSRLLQELAELGANTYNWLVWHQATDWDDLQRFLPRARAQNLRVWVTLVPPSESPPRTKTFSEPYRLDYERWAQEIARLSLAEPNLVAWSIDDFAHNLSVYTPAKLRLLLEGARRLNPRLAFVPCVYFRQITPAFAASHGGLLDGVLFPYRNESVKANLTDPGQVAAEVARVRQLFPPGLPVIVDVYATRHSSLGDSTPEYVAAVLAAGRAAADGVMVYCHQNPKNQAAKHAIIRRAFAPISSP